MDDGSASAASKEKNGNEGDDEGGTEDEYYYDDDDDGEEEEKRRLRSGPQTPNISESAKQLRRSLSVQALQDLAHMPPGQLRKSVGQKIWRPQDEEARIPGDWERLAVHVFRGGMRGFNLAFMLRGSVMLVFALIRAIRTKKVKGNAFVLALFGADNIRFSLMFASWTALYKATQNSLRLLTPLPPPKNRSSRSNQPGSGNTSGEELGSGTGAATPGAATPKSGLTELEGKSGREKAMIKAKQKRRAFMKDPRSRVWHAYVAGAVSGLAILVEKKDSRISLAQQLLVRGFEGFYNLAHARGLITIPHGAVLTFGLACGQIMYAWLNQPHTLPRSYISWITQASQVAPPATDIHRDAQYSSVAKAEKALQYFPDGTIPSPIKTSSGKLRYPNVPPSKNNRRGITGKNVAGIVEWMKRADAGEEFRTIPCELVHPWENSHLWSPVDRFLEVTRWILPVYATLHFVPAVFLRMRAFRKDPIRVFLRSLFGSVRSSSFLGVFVIIFQTIFCAAHDAYAKIIADPALSAATPTWVKDFLTSTAVHWLAGFATCLSLFVEHSRRRTELAMYVLPKGMESAWSVARQRSWVPFVPGGDLLLTSAGMSLVMGTYAQNPEHLSGLVRRVVYQFVGRN
ncbi:hypothetical protein FA10DRAFT_291704 [Acaromyces ingoldii]|uniref:Transmembrane protein 135 N-terminal domain-containing protein n=1 Tax=Acaromyces ingoldii TaxID=215250 RepID=A0A316Z088_9BASI|nr:hypothetical protein FA10DRAFT_291704 [Acaromyces ingoldii]PWN94424.1 hypothetical protein FA10DRAFT_291704 [Acaromyces ingoldii]